MKMKNFRIKKLGVKITLLVIAIITIIMSITIFIVVDKTNDMISLLTIKQAEAANYALEEKISSLRNEVLERATLIADSDSVIRALAYKDKEYLIDTLDNLGKTMDFVTICDAEGMVITRTHRKESGDNIINQKVIFETLSIGVGYSLIGRKEDSGLVILGTAAVYYEDEVIGVVVCGFDLSNSKYMDEFKKQNNYNASIFDGNKRISTTIFGINQERITGTSIDQAAADIVLNTGKHYSGRVTILDEVHQSYYSPLIEDGKVIGILGTSVDITDTLKEQEHMIYWIVGSTITGLFLFSVLISFLGRYLISIPLKKIGEAAKKIECESSSISKIEVISNDEIGHLSQIFNDMLDRLSLSSTSLDMLKNILNSIDIFIYVSDPYTDEVLFINSKMQEAFGIDDNAIGEACWKVFQKDFKCRCDFCPNAKLLENMDSVVIWEEHNTVTSRYYKNVDRIINWPGGVKVHMQHGVDITESKNNESALNKRFEQQQLLSAILQNFNNEYDISEFIMNAFQMMGEFIGVNKVFLSKFNKPPKNTTKRKNRSINRIYEWYNDKSVDIACSTEEIQKIINENEKIFIDFENEGYASIIKDEKSLMLVPITILGNTWGMLGFVSHDFSSEWEDKELVLSIRDILAGVINRQNMREHLIRMSSVIDSSPHYIAYSNPNGEYNFVNPGASVVTGYSHEELMKGGYRILFDNDTLRYFMEEVIPGVYENGKVDLEIPIIRKDGQKRIMGSSIFLTESDALGIGCIASDITEQKQLEKGILEAKETAEKASRAKGDFLSHMSHEMRTPLNAIIGMTSIGKNASDLTKKDYCLSKIDDASKHLLGVINDILDMSKIEAGRFEMSLYEFDFEKMLSNVVGVVNFRAEEKKQNIIVNVDEDIPDFIISDEQRINQVLTNLLSNAIKFTPEKGKITLTADVVNVVDSTYTLQMEVEDNGIGISKEAQARLFTAFEQASGGISRKYGGTGLGLAISKQIVERMNGKIWVESKLGHGSKFIFTINAEKGKTQTKATLPSHINKSAIRILAVDDSPAIREYFIDVMSALGLYCDVAEDARSALSMIEENEENPYNIFFVDWKMPMINGMELTSMIKDLSGNNSVVIMISSATDVENEAQKVGIDHFIQKPLFPSTLLNAITECINANATVAAELDSQDNEINEQNFEEKNVLLAEDVEINREIVAELLSDTGLNIDFAENGLQAVEMFKNAPQKYDLILMDIHMPEMDGYDAANNIRLFDFPTAKSIPIIAMTADVFLDDIRKCLESGMNDHVGKPLDVDELFEKLHKYLN